MYIFLWVIFIPSMQMHRVRYHAVNQFSITIHLFDLVNLMNVSYEKNSNTLIVTILVIHRAWINVMSTIVHVFENMHDIIFQWKHP